MQRKVRVLRIISRLNVGGPALHCLLLSEKLGEQGMETVLVTGKIAPGEACFESLHGVEPKGFRLVHLEKMSRLPSALGDLVSLWELIRIVRRERPDIVHTHTAKAGMLGRIAAVAAGVPVVVHTFHGHVLSGYFSPFFSGLLRQIERVLAWRSTVLVTLSSQLVDELCGKFRVARREKFRIIPLGRDLGPFRAAERGPLRRELGLSDSVKLIGCIGRLVPIKNHELLFTALRDLPANLDWRLVLVGDGELRQSLAARVQELGLKERVLFLGWRSDLPRVYADLDLVALTSLNEGTPLSLIEAFASSRAVVATRVGGVESLFAPNPPLVAGPAGVELRPEGALVASGDVASLTRALAWYLESPEKQHAAGAAALHSSERFSDENLVRNIARLYRELHGEASQRGLFGLPIRRPRPYKGQKQGI